MYKANSLQCWDWETSWQCATLKGQISWNGVEILVTGEALGSYWILEDNYWGFKGLEWLLVQEEWSTKAKR